MSTTNLSAGQVMDRAAALMNDPAKTDYTYAAQLVYLNMAIDELVEELEESNASPTNQTLAQFLITVPVGTFAITPAESSALPHYPDDLVEIQEVSERLAGTQDAFIPLTRKEFVPMFLPGHALMQWCWEDQIIKFNTRGAITPREILLKYIRQGIQQALSETSIIGTINARSYLTYKTAAFCAMFIGENESRAQVLEGQAEKALERLTGISNKGKQQIMTRHRPFRASYKARGGF